MSTGTLWTSSFRQLNKPEQHKRRNELKQLDMRTRFLIPAVFAAVGACIASAGVASAGSTDSPSCSDRLREALGRHFGEPDSGTTTRRLMHVTAVRRIGEELDSSSVLMESIDGRSVHVIKVDSVVRWEDEHTMVVIDRRRRTIRLTDLRPRRAALSAQKRIRHLFCDSIVDAARSIECSPADVSDEADLRVVVTLHAGASRLYNAAAITAYLNERNDIVRFAVRHPSGSPVRYTDYRVLESDRRYGGIDPNLDVRTIVFDESGQLLPEYENYRVVRRGRH